MNAGHDHRLPDELTRVPDIRSSDLHAEIRRCAEILRWVEALPAAELISPQTPVLEGDLVTAVVPMYNATRWIEACLKGLLAQTHRNLEIICVDDCSQDDTYERVVDQFGRHGRLCVIRLARNVGPFQISNWVVGSLARGRLIAWQDADNVSHPARIEAQYRWMSQQGYRMSGTCVHHFLPTHIKPFFRHTPPLEVDGLLHEILTYVSVPRAHGLEERQDDSPQQWERAWQRNEVSPARAEERGLAVRAFQYRFKEFCSHGSEIVERELFREFGGFYGRTKVAEDSSFAWRVSRFHDIGNLPRVLCSRRAHSDSLTRHPDTNRESPARLQYAAFKNAKQEEITRALHDGNTRRAHDLCTETLHCAEIQVERAHCGFDIALS